MELLLRIVGAKQTEKVSVRVVGLCCRYIGEGRGRWCRVQCDLEILVVCHKGFQGGVVGRGGGSL